MKFHQSPVMHVGKVQINVSDIERSTVFYEKIIGLKVLEKTAKKVVFTANGENPLLVIEQPENIIPKRMQTTGLYHFALLLPKREDLANIVRHFAKNGIRFASGDHLVSEAIYLNDPDGNGIEIYVDRDPSTWNWQDGEVEMTTDPVDFDNLLLETTDIEWRGMPEDTLMGHIHLQVGDLAENEKFYIDGLGFEIVNRFGNSALFISDHQYHHHIAFNIWNGRGLPNASENMVGLVSYSIVFKDEKTREKLIHHLENSGIAVKERNGLYFVEDPSQVRVEFVVGVEG